MHLRLALAALLIAIPSFAQTPLKPSPIAAEIDKRAAAIEQEMLGWRRHLH